jgi:predicted secreted protein
MDNYSLILKCLTAGIILMFVGVSSISSTAQDLQQTSLVPLAEKHHYFYTTPGPLPLFGGWMKTFGGAGDDYGYTVLQTTDGGYVIVGETYSFGGGTDIWVIKTDGDGNTVWDTTFGGVNTDYNPDIKQTTDDGFIITARTYSFGAGANDIWVIKLDKNGTEQWNTTYGKEFVEYNGECQQTTDGGYIIVGTTSRKDPLNFDLWLIKIDSESNEEWNRTFQTAPQSFEFGLSVQQTHDSGYLIAGSYISYGTNTSYDIWLIKTDAQGNEQWNRIYRENSSWKGTCSIEPTSDGGYIVLANRGYYESKQVDFFLMKINQYGDEQWNRTYGGLQDDYASEAYQTSDGGYIIIGYTVSYGAGEADVWMIKTDAYGDELWNRTYGRKHNDAGHSIDLTRDGGYIITGIKGTSSKDDPAYDTYDIWLIKTDSQGKSKTPSFDTYWLEKSFQRFPNAFPILRQLRGC